MTTYIPLQQLMGDGTAREQHNLLLTEANARTHHHFTSWLIPGLLQTRDYARQRLREFTDMSGCPDTVEETVDLRMRRRALLHDPTHTFRFVIHENALYAAMAPGDVMRAQLTQLYEDIDRLPSAIGIVPIASACYPPMNEFWLLDKEVAQVETLTAFIHISDPPEVEQYVKLWRHYATRAVCGAPARTAVGEALGHWAGK